MSRFAVLCATAASLVAIPAFGQVTVTVGASKDNTLFESLTGLESSGAGVSLFAGRTDGNDGNKARRGLIAFDLAGLIPANATITGVSLTLFLAQAGFSSLDERVALHEVQADWGESSSLGLSGKPGVSANGDATWLHRFYSNTFWTTPGGDFDPTISASAVMKGSGQFYTWSGAGMVEDVEGWVAAPGTNFGWLLQGDESTTLTALRFNSRQIADADFRPQLAITYSVVPEPTAAALLCVGGALIAGTRRRQKNDR